MLCCRTFSNLDEIFFYVEMKIVMNGIFLNRAVEHIQIDMIILNWIFLCYSPILIPKGADSKMIMTES